jgi:signal peptidase I
MFGLFTSAQKRARHDAHNWLHLAGKIYHFRRDQLPVQEIEALQLAEHELRTRLKERADAAKLKMGIEKLEGCLRRSGGSFYPKSSMVDNVEFFLVAMILFLGIRAFIVQPFKIPTNSMWPTYNGLTAESFVDAPIAERGNRASKIGTISLLPKEAEPGRAEGLLRLVLFGATAVRVDAPVDGEIRIPVVRGALFKADDISQRRWLVLPGTARRYTLYVGGRPVTITVPTDFRFDSLVMKTFFAEPGSYAEAEKRVVGDPRTGMAYIPTGRRVKAGERVVSFDVLTGDQLFVDRVSYHFVAPKPGDGFVFRTQHIPWVEENAPTEFVDKYYIKRLVGLPGDTLEVRAPVLYRNGAPITGAAAFAREAGQAERYPGYVAVRRLAPGQTVTVEPKKFFAMGDNSPDSADSRYWGFIPEGDVVGRPIWIYFPFTRRWGPAR